MSCINENISVVEPTQKIYDVAVDRDFVNWKLFLSELIHKEGLNPWDIDISILTKKYLENLQKLKSVDFDIGGKFLTIAVYLLKTKTKTLLDSDIRGMDIVIENFQNSNNENFDDFNFDDLDNPLDDFSGELDNKPKSYNLKYRNPIARKRKVTIFDLIKTLESTFKQSNKRRRDNFLIRRQNNEIDYSGPIYNKPKKDLRELIEDIFNVIKDEFKTKKGGVHFHSILEKSTEKIESKMHILEKFIPVLHLHNNSKIKLSQEKHFGKINITDLENN